MRRFFVIGGFVSVGALLLGACGSDSNGGGTGGATGGSGGGLAASGGIGATGGTAASGGTSASGGTGNGGTGGGGTTGSCAGLCGSSDPVPGSDPECYCDDACTNNGDCCADKETECPATLDGVCKKYCCSAADCGSGETCTALDAANIGTLGVCSAGAAPDSGTGGAGGSAGGGAAGAPPTDAGTPDTGAAGAPPVDGGSGLPAGCVNVTPPCNPLTNAPCGAGEACDLGQNGLQCFQPPNDVQPGGACSNSTGPFCIGGYHCSPP